MRTDRTPGTVGFPHLLVGGVVLAAAVVWSAGKVGPPGFARPFTRWGGLLAGTGVWPDHDRWPGVVLAVALCALVAVWLLAVRVVRVDGWSHRSVWVLGAAWTAPLAVGPPILSNDVFSYVAQGAVARNDEDPTTVSAFSLGWDSPLTQAVDPMWRGTPSPYGPLATLLQRWAVVVAGDHPVFAVVALRVVAVAAVAGIAALAVSISRATTADPGRREPLLLMLVWANPLVSLHVVAAIHLEGVLVLLVMLAIRLLVVRTPGADVAAVVCAAAAAAVKLPVGAVVAAVAVAVIAGRAASLSTRIRHVTVSGSCVAATYAGLCGLTGSGWNVLAVVRAPAAGRTPAAPATLLATGLSPLRWLGSTDAGALDAFGRLTCAALAVAAIGFLVVTARRRSPAASAGLGLLALAAGSPVLYPWYLVWSLPLLAVVATGAWRRRLVLGSALGAVMTVQGLTHLETWALASTIVTAGLVAVWCTEREARARVLVTARRAQGGRSARAGTVRE